MRTQLVRWLITTSIVLALSILIMLVIFKPLELLEKKRAARRQQAPAPWPPEISKQEVEERAYQRLLNQCTNYSRPPCPKEWFIPWGWWKPPTGERR